MQSKNNAPTAAQKRWREAVRELGSYVSGSPAVIHHPIGVTGKHNKIHIGHWWNVPLTNEEHIGLHAGETFGFESRKEFEKAAFIGCYHALNETGLQPPDEVVDAILDYHR